jgi:hypothetical protein
MKSDDTLIVARLVAQLSIALKEQIIGREKGYREPGLMAQAQTLKVPTWPSEAIPRTFDLQGIEI